MDNVGGAIPKYSKIKWCRSTPSAWIYVCPALEKFLNNIQVSTENSEVKWCVTTLVSRIHGDTLIEECLDAIQVSAPSRIVNGCHLYSLVGIIFLLDSQVPCNI